jgi:hypothetical protein
MNFKILTILAIVIYWYPLYFTNSAQAQPLSHSTTWERKQQLSSTSDLTQLSSISQWGILLERRLQQESPLFYLFLVELEQFQFRPTPDLQQQAEEEILNILQKPQPLQQRLLPQ